MALLGASSSSSSQAIAIHRYDVFISFRGEDTRNGFTSHLHSALLRNHINTFIDKSIPKGGGVWDELVEAIRNSKLFLVIFSENYASSTWCLRELVEIMERKKKNENNVIVIPVFYKIEPTHVRHQTGSYLSAFDEHERSSDRCHVQQWRTALFQASSLSGFPYDDRRKEAKLIDKIVETILPKLRSNNCYRDEHKSPFICNRNYASVKSSLRTKLEKVHVIGIWGMAGIGKTTIATTLFNECSSEYEGRCFLAFSKGLEGQGVNHVCAIILSELLNEDLRIDNIRVIRSSSVFRKLKHMKVFIVLDDVTNSQIVTDLIQEFHDCLSVGSRIILATRDRNVLTSGGVEEIHEVKEMDFEDSLKLFSYYAFNASQPKEGYYQLSTRFVADYAQGIPLALTILGSFLKTKGEREWVSALRKLRKYPNGDVQQVLRLSYDALDDDEKYILLDVACCFIGHQMEEVIGILNSCGFFADIGIKNLLDKSLISINSYNDEKFIKMHALIKEMCWKISCEEDSRNGGQQTRLWHTEEIYNILQDDKRDIHGVESMIVDMKTITIDPRLIIIALRKMPKLRLLALRGNINQDLEWNRELPEDFQLPNDLRLWEAPGKYNTKDIQSIEMVAEDCKGQRIHVSVPKGMLRRWRAHLQEFKCYKITNVMVVDPRIKSKLRTIPCAWYLDFSHRTTVQNLEPGIFPCIPFRFRSVNEILDENVVLANDTFDFIGEVVGKEDPRDLVTNSGIATKRVVVVLQDTENQRINCILFGPLVDQIASYLEKPQEEALIVILQYFKVSRWNGKTSVQSNFELSKVHINADFKEVVEFRNRLANNGPTLSGRISQVQSEGGWAGVEELINGKATVHTIEEVSMLTKQGQAWISAKIVALNVGINDWSYTACGGCAKKVKGEEGSSLKPKHCVKDNGERYERYKVEAIAHDPTGYITLLMWDREVKTLCGKAAEELKKEEVDSEDDYPPSLNKMLERKLLFKIHVRTSNINNVDPVFPVIKLIDDDELISRFTPAKKPDLDGNTSNLPSEFGGNAINLMSIAILIILWLMWMSPFQPSMPKRQLRQLPPH